MTLTQLTRVLNALTGYTLVELRTPKCVVHEKVAFIYVACVVFKHRPTNVARWLQCTKAMVYRHRDAIDAAIKTGRPRTGDVDVERVKTLINRMVRMSRDYPWMGM